MTTPIEDKLPGNETLKNKIVKKLLISALSYLCKVILFSLAEVLMFVVMIVVMVLMVVEVVLVVAVLALVWVCAPQSLPYWSVACLGYHGKVHCGVG